MREVLIIAGEAYQKERWKEAGLDPALARIVYRDLPKLMGYEPVQDLEYAFEWRGQEEEKR